MGKFKIGDRVKVTHTDYAQFEIGDVTHIVHVEDDGADLYCDDFEDGLYFYDWEFEPATSDTPKFTVGDRVRFVSNSGDNESVVGKTGVIFSKRTQDSYYDWTVKLDEYNVNGHDGDGDIPSGYGRYAKDSDLEPVAVAHQPQLAIRAGHYYRTRDGRKVGPMERNSGKYDPQYGFTVNHDFNPNYGKAWRADGSFSPDEDKDHPADLIAEWVDEPAVAEPKFKVGDRVHYKDEICEGIGVITEPNGDDDWFVEVEEHDREWAPFDNMTTRVFDSVDLRLVAPATSGKRETFTVKDAKFFIGDGNGGWTQISGKKPAIVALIENGQPKPAKRPFVHPDRESAAKEARRLAGKHKGQEFGVYELVDTAKEAKVYEHEWQRLAVNKKTGDAAKEMRKLTGLSLGDSKRAVFGWFAKQAA